MKEVWEEHLVDEISYWKSMIDGSFYNKEWVAGFHNRVKGIDIFPSHLREYLNDGYRVLDVGSGPATVLGGMVNGKAINIIAVDPLAEQYNNLYKEHGISPLIKPVYGEAENLTAVVEGKFDFVYSRNALDHSYAPLKAIQSMIDVCAKNGVVYFENAINEGLHENYKGLHQWNFMPSNNGELIIWNKNDCILLSQELGSTFKSFSAYIVREKWVAVKIIV